MGIMSNKSNFVKRTLHNTVVSAVHHVDIVEYRDGLKGGPVMLSSSQAEILCNLGSTFKSISVQLYMKCLIWKIREALCEANGRWQLDTIFGIAEISQGDKMSPPFFFPAQIHFFSCSLTPLILIYCLPKRDTHVDVCGNYRGVPKT